MIWGVMRRVSFLILLTILFCVCESAMAESKKNPTKPKVLNAGIALFKNGAYQESIAELSKLSLEGRAEAERFFYIALAYTKLGKYQEAMSFNKKAYTLEYMPQILHNSACIASLQKRPTLAFAFLSELWRGMSSEERKKQFKKIEQDPDLKLFRASELYDPIKRAFTGKALVEVKSSPLKGQEAFRAGKFKAEDAVDFQGIVIETPKRLEMKETNNCVTVKMYSMTSGRPHENFGAMRDLIAIDTLTKKQYRAFYGIVSEELEIPPPRENIFQYPPGWGVAWEVTKSGGRSDLTICGLGLPNTNATYKMYIETDFERSNVVGVTTILGGR